MTDAVEGGCLSSSPAEQCLRGTLGACSVQPGETPTDAVTEAARKKMERAVGGVIDQAGRVTGSGEPLPSCSQRELPRLQSGMWKAEACKGRSASTERTVPF